MSRAMLLSLGEGQVVAHCLKAKVEVSAIEGLIGGGVRLVCRSTAGAEIMRETLKKHLIEGDALRERHRPTTPLW
jgi:2-phosphoglycerate kinase